MSILRRIQALRLENKRLRSENKRLTAEVALWKDVAYGSRPYPNIHAMRTEIDTLRKQIKELRHP